ncbi:MAG TPA: ABC transporter permease [Candidatus Acidoferrales bacterium]|nr:ABC transporter permease [Candidatus Acidoferrales bacterium]
MKPEHWLYTVPLRMRSLFRRRRADMELDDELRDHIARKTQDYMARGMTPPEARRAALIELGGLEQAKEECRDTRHVRWLQDLLQDLRFGLRMLRKSPGFTAVAVLTLTLGIGASSTVFSVVNAVLLEPMPYPDSKSLVYLIDSNPSQGWPRFASSPANFLDWRAQSRSFEQVVACARDTGNVALGEIPEQWRGLAVTEGFFQALRVQPAIGRLFDSSDFVAGKERLLVLSDALWHGEFGGDPSVIGRGIQKDGNLYTIVGVMPPGFQFGGDSVLYWTPFVFDKSLAAARGAHFLRVFARLRDGVSITTAQAEMKTIAAHLERQYPESDQGWTVLVDPIRAATVRNVQSALLVLFGAVALVLLIACANEANMLLSRAVVRRREMAIRIALGARRSRIVRQLLTESVLLALVGSVFGLLMALLAGRALASLPANILPRAQSIHIDSRVLAFTFVLALATGIIFGLAPALSILRDDPYQKVNVAETHSRRRESLRRLLVVSEVALAFVLVAGSGLLIRSFFRLTSVQPGFQTQARLSFDVSLPQSRYSSPNKWSALFDQAREQLASLPGVLSADLTSLTPLNGDTSVWTFGVNGEQNRTSLPSATYYLVSPGYFRDMGIPLLAGRDFTPDDSAAAPHVCLINDFLARTAFPGRNPIGQRVQIGRNYDVVRQIVGVVGSVKQEGLDTGETFQVYEPFDQMPEPDMTLILHVGSNPQSLLPAARRVIQQLDSQQPIVNPRTLDDYAASSVALPRFRTQLFALFGILALTLAVIGLYGVMSYSVTQKFQEIGIRMALGAQRGDIYGFVLRGGMLLAVAGVFLGILGALIFSQFVSSFLFEVTPRDPATFLGVALLFVAVSALACWLPARRAMNVDPMIALRYE